MRKYVTILLVCIPFLMMAQPADTSQKKKSRAIGIGLKGGLNFANVTKAASINASNRTGFNVGVFRSMTGMSVFGFRMELIYSRQGYNFKTSTNTGAVDLDYILYGSYTAINIGKYGQIYLGAQMAYLLNAKADSTATQTTSPAMSASPMMKYYNRIDYGAAGGLEVYPYKGILFGARYNISFSNSTQNPNDGQAPAPSFIPSFNAKNNVLQIYIGYKF